MKLCSFVFAIVITWPAKGNIPRAVFSFHGVDQARGSRYLKVEALRDDLLHFETYERREPVYGNHRFMGPDKDALWISPMVDETTYGQFKGANSFKAWGTNTEQRGLETNAIKVEICPTLGCISIFDKIRNTHLTVLRTKQLSDPIKTLHLEKLNMKNVYGVGNLFLHADEPDGDWVEAFWKGNRWEGAEWKARGHGNFRQGLDLGDEFHHGGGPSQSQFPMIYVLGSGRENFGLFLDQVYKTSWNFEKYHFLSEEDTDGNGKEGWSASMWGDEIRFFVMVGYDIKHLRSSYMDLVGKPPVPPKSVLGYWSSEFGYNDWEELKEDLASLRATDFPVDGAALDLQWFGGAFGEPCSHRMGSLSFWEQKPFTSNSGSFPDPDVEIKKLADEFGIQLMPIEESYVDSTSDRGDFRAMANPNFRLENRDFNRPFEPYKDCYLARVNLKAHPGSNGNDPWEPVFVTTDYRVKGDARTKNWWGTGGMIDWTNPDARRYWHELKRHALALKGIFNFWGDLMEPEMYYQDAVYYGLPGADPTDPKNFGLPGLWKHDHGSIHNIYGLSWARGVREGMERHPEQYRRALGKLGALYPKTPHDFEFDHPARHFTLTRAGTIGSHRYGGMWSGDVASNMGNLTAHLQTQMHMSLLGLDLYSSDTGGFFHQGRNAGDDYDKQVVTQWAAAASLLDLPLRTHAWADGEIVDWKTGKRILNLRFGLDVRGHLDSNRANVRRRYELIPYIYSLLHRAHLTGEPVFPPLVYHYQEDPNVRRVGSVKMIGDALIFKVIADPDTLRTQVYLPKGKWFDYENNKTYAGGKKTGDVDLYRMERVPFAERLEDPDRAYFLLPLFAKAGAIIPKMYVDEHTMNVFGRRKDGSVRDELIVRVYADETPSAFTLYEDDGLTTAYQDGQRGLRTTRISQHFNGTTATVTIAHAVGSYQLAPENKLNAIELVANGRTARTVSLNKHRCAEMKHIAGWKKAPEDVRRFKDDLARFEQAGELCWYHKDLDGLIRASSVERVAVSEEKMFEVEIE